MALFTWYKSYSVNNQELDNHHKTLFAIINRLYDNCMVQGAANCLGPILEELAAYSEYHFSAEEQYMRDRGYRGIHNHILEHGVFTRKTAQLRQVIHKDDLELTKELIAFLGNWLLHHVMQEDKKYAA